MKKIQLLLLSFLFTTLIYSQQNDKDRISVVSKNKDTLWLINNDLGKLIARTWDYPKYIVKNRPRIIMVDVLPTINYIEIEKKKNKKRFRG